MVLCHCGEGGEQAGGGKQGGCRGAFGAIYSVGGKRLRTKGGRQTSWVWAGVGWRGLLGWGVWGFRFSGCLSGRVGF